VPSWLGLSNGDCKSLDKRFNWKNPAPMLKVPVQYGETKGSAAFVRVAGRLAGNALGSGLGAVVRVPVRLGSACPVPDLLLPPLQVLAQGFGQPFLPIARHVSSFAMRGQSPVS
jgi:hypothetical protein